MKLSTKADILDSLQYLAEININIKKLKSGEMNEEEFCHFVKKRSEEFNYIADAEKTLKIMHSVSKIDAKE